MLILSRLVGQSVVIGDDITITVLRFKKGQVSLGVDGWACQIDTPCRSSAEVADS